MSWCGTPGLMARREMVRRERAHPVALELPPCPRTGEPHRVYWVVSAFWCEDCRQKLVTCCDGR